MLRYLTARFMKLGSRLRGSMRNLGGSTSVMPLSVECRFELPFTRYFLTSYGDCVCSCLIKQRICIFPRAVWWQIPFGNKTLSATQSDENSAAFRSGSAKCFMEAHGMFRMSQCASRRFAERGRRKTHTHTNKASRFKTVPVSHRSAAQNRPFTRALPSAPSFSLHLDAPGGERSSRS